MTEQMWLGLFALLQTASTLWINWSIKTNACGGDKCLAMFEQLKRNNDIKLVSRQLPMSPSGEQK